MTAAIDVFRQPIAKRWLPPEMTQAPSLDVPARIGTTECCYALLINPFYPKDANASFGKHVLTPTLALTSFAATTPAHWRVEYWDENLLHGRPPCDPMPEVVGITVHLTFAKRAYELADWYRARGVKVILGGLHVLSCPDECAPHADALALGDGVQLWPRILARCRSRQVCSRATSATYENDYRDDPPPRRAILPRHSFLTTTSLIATRGCHNRCGFCYLATDGLRMPYRMRDPQQIAAEFPADDQPYAVFVDNNLGSRRDYLRALCDALRPLNKIWSAAVSIDVTDDPSLIRDMALAGCTGVFVGFESLDRREPRRCPQEDAEDRRLRPPRAHPARQRNSGERLVRARLRSRPQGRLRPHRGMDRGESAGVRDLPHPDAVSRRRRSSGRWKRKAASCIATGLCTTPAHAVFRPKHMTPEELEHGYAWIYQRLFSHASIWRRRPEQLASHSALSRHVVSVQALQPLLAPADQAPPGAIPCGNRWSR